MAGEAVVDLPAEGEVIVDIPVAGQEATPQGGTAQQDAPTIRDLRSAAERSSVVDESTDALSKAVKNEEQRRKAAEATAAAERERANQALRIAAQRDQAAVAAETRAQTSELAILTSGLANAEGELASAKQEWQRAQESGEFEKAADAMARISKAASAVDRLSSAKTAFEATVPKTASGAVEAPSERQVQSQVPPFEQYVSNPVFSPKAQAWLRAHPDCVPPQVGGNAQKHNAMMAGHHAALARGLAEGTDEYFQAIEEQVEGKTQPPPQQPRPRRAGSRRQSPAGAPPRARSRGAAAAGGCRRRPWRAARAS